MNLTRVIKNIVFLLIAVSSCLTFVVIAAGVTSPQNEFGPLNSAVEAVISPFRSSLLNGIMLAITNFGSPIVLSLVAVLLAVMLVLHSDVYDTMLYICSITFAVVSFIVLKNAFGIPRPPYSLIKELTGSSFPSGHATVSTAFFFTTAYVFSGLVKRWSTRISLVAFCITAAALISLSRLYLGTHYTVDVLAGIALGLFSVSFMVLIFNLFLSEREWWRRRVKSLSSPNS